VLISCVVCIIQIFRICTLRSGNPYLKRYLKSLGVGDPIPKISIFQPFVLEFSEVSFNTHIRSLPVI
jgi:hypothetical protein